MIEHLVALFDTSIRYYCLVLVYFNTNLRSYKQNFRMLFTEDTTKFVKSMNEVFAVR